MRDYTMTDTFGTEYTPVESTAPDAVSLPVGDGTYEFVPWAIARLYPEGTTVEEIVADIKSEEDAD